MPQIARYDKPLACNAIWIKRSLGGANNSRDENTAKVCAATTATQDPPAIDPTAIWSDTAKRQFAVTPSRACTPLHAIPRLQSSFVDHPHTLEVDAKERNGPADQRSLTALRKGFA